MNYQELDTEVRNGFLADLDPNLRRLLERNPGLVLAGGCIRSWVQNEEPNDIDFMVTDEADLDAIYADFELFFGKHKYASRNGRTYTSLNLDIQVVTRWRYSAKTHVERFDFTICQAAIWYDGEWKSWCNENFVTDSLDRVVIYTQPDRPEEPLGSLARAMRFESKGYKLGHTEFGKIAAQMERRVMRERETDAEIMLQPAETQWATWSRRARWSKAY